MNTATDAKKLGLAHNRRVHDRVVVNDATARRMVCRFASLGYVLAACGSPKPTAARDPSSPIVAVAEVRGSAEDDVRCATSLERRTPKEPLGPEWDTWLERGMKLDLPSATAVDPTEVTLREIREQVVLARHGEARFEADGPPFTDAGGSAYMFPVFVLDVDQEQARVRIVSEFEGSELFIWVNQVDLLPVPVVRVQLSQPGSSGSSRSSGVWLAPGRALNPISFDGNAVRVAVTEAGLSVEGTLPMERFGYVFASDHFSAVKGEDVELIPGEILAVPGGAPIAIGDPSSDTKGIEGYVRILEADGRWRFIEVVSYDFTFAARGYVTEDRVLPWARREFVASPFGGGSNRGANELPASKAGERRLARGTRLLSDEGAVVGLIRWPSDLPDCGADRVAIPTHWGPLVLRIDDSPRARARE